MSASRRRRTATRGPKQVLALHAQARHSLRRRKCWLNALRLRYHGVANEPDVLPQRVRLAGETCRYPDVRCSVLDPLQVGEPLLDRQCAGAPTDLAFEQRQLTIQTVKTGMYVPGEKLRQ